MVPDAPQHDSSPVEVNIARSSRRWPYERRILAWTLLLAMPGLALAALVLFAYDAPWGIWLFGWLPVALTCVVLAFVVRNKAGYPLRTLANLVEALRQEDFALRGVTGPPPGALYELITEINYLGEDLRQKRFAGVEADLERVMYVSGAVRHVDDAVGIAIHPAVRSAVDAAARVAFEAVPGGDLDADLGFARHARRIREGLDGACHRGPGEDGGEQAAATDVDQPPERPAKQGSMRQHPSSAGPCETIDETSSGATYPGATGVRQGPVGPERRPQFIE